MNTIRDDTAVRTMAEKALDARKSQQFPLLMSLSCIAVKQRAHFLGHDNSNLESSLQWQPDLSGDVLQHCSNLSSINSSTVYYKRLDEETLQAMIEFARVGEKHYVVLLLLEGSEWKYYNTREISNWSEWVSDWETSIPKAKQQLKALDDSKLNKLDLPKVDIVTNETTVLYPLHDDEYNSDSDDDYWGQYGIEEGDKQQPQGSSTPGLTNDEGDDDDTYWDQYALKHAGQGEKQEETQHGQEPLSNGRVLSKVPTPPQTNPLSPDAVNPEALSNILTKLQRQQLLEEEKHETEVTKASHQPDDRYSGSESSNSLKSSPSPSTPTMTPSDASEDFKSAQKESYRSFLVENVRSLLGMASVAGYTKGEVQEIFEAVGMEFE